jgi:SAM-dependent methyltransferase
MQPGHDSFVTQDVGPMRDFYIPARGGPNLFEVWEKGEARGDSVTPSVYSPAYRTWMRNKIITAIRSRGSDRLLSLGSGNAAVEREVLDAGYPVLAVDVLPEAVDIARAKGLDAIVADVLTWEPATDWPVIYADGLFGHLYGRSHDLVALFARLRSWLTSGGSAGTLVVSNDGPNNDEPMQPARNVPGFFWLSGTYLREQALAGGFDEVVIESFPYQRPVSGRRARVVVTAHAS